MKHYIRYETKEIFAYEEDGSQDAYIAEGAVFVTDEELAAYRYELANLPEVKSETERQWRDAELVRADLMLNRIQDGMSGFGSIGPWRSYRVDLRNWPENPEFPKTACRPVAPDYVAPEV